MARSIKNLIAAILISLSCYLAWTQALPAYTVTSFLSSRLDEKNILLASRTETIQKIDKLKSEVNSRYSELQRLALVIPEQKGLAEIVTSLDSIYSGSGVNIPELKITDVKSIDTKGLIGIEVDNNATYSQLVSLLRAIEKSTRIIDINSVEISISAESKNVKGLKDPVLTAILKGQAYWIKPGVTSNSNTATVKKDEVDQ
jgi:Tfp pilus assembly protein PilO